LLGTPDGIVDLRDGTFRAACPEDHVTKSTAVSPEGECRTWLAFLQRATGGDVDVQTYLQRLCGYALTGCTREQSLYFASGPGGGGKGTLMHAVSSILHDYHVVTAIATLTDAKFDRHPAEVAALQGARLVTCSETERGRHWAESRIKEWTGGDAISARFMNQNFFTFIPTFKLLISGNYKPHLRPDTAMRRRFQLIPFKTAIPKSEQDPMLGAKLKKEWPGILGWMIAGAVEWQRVGLSPPATVLDATAEYMDDEAEDVLSAWMHERCEVDPTAETSIGDLYRSYKLYAEQAGESRHDECDARQRAKAPGLQVETNRPGTSCSGVETSSSDRTYTAAWWSARCFPPSTAAILTESNGKPNLPRRCHAEISGSDNRWPSWRPPTGFRRAAHGAYRGRGWV
jgi:putative DNA primase/helicase